jgi:hypothetical protein
MPITTREPVTIQVPSQITVIQNAQPSESQAVRQIYKSWQTTWWAGELSVSEDVLLDAIDRVGYQADAVEIYLSIHRTREQHH